MPGRKYSASSLYRYGFNGKENDNDVKDEGNQQDYGMRIYDPRLGRFLSVDPLMKSYPELTPYQFASNTPIQAIDLDGAESGIINKTTGEIIALGPTNMATYRVPPGWAIYTGPISYKNSLNNINDCKPPVYKPTLQLAQDVLQSQPKKIKTAPNSQISVSWTTVSTNRNPQLVKEWSDNYRKALAFSADMRMRSALDPISYGGPGFGLGLVRDPFVQTAATGVGGRISFVVGGYMTYQGLQSGNYSQAAQGGLMMQGSSSSVFGKSQTGIGYRAVEPKYAKSTLSDGFYKSGEPGRLGNDGIYANNTIEGAVKEFEFHHPGVKPSVFEVHFPYTKPLDINPAPSGYVSGTFPFTSGANILTTPSIRAPGTTNILIRQGATVGKQIQ